MTIYFCFMSVHVINTFYLSSHCLGISIKFPSNRIRWRLLFRQAITLNYVRNLDYGQICNDVIDVFSVSDWSSLVECSAVASSRGTGEAGNQCERIQELGTMNLSVVA